MLPGWGLGALGGGYPSVRRFEEQYHCYSVAYADKAHLEVSGAASGGLSVCLFVGGVTNSLNHLFLYRKETKSYYHLLHSIR